MTHKCIIVQMKRVFIFGGSGMLGWMTAHYLSTKGHNVVALSRKDFDATQNSVDDFNSKYTPTKDDIILNAIGITNRHNDAQSKDVFFKVNGDFPKVLDELSGKIGCTFFHITTDCAYEGTSGGYWESSRKDGSDTYALSKIAGEDLKNAVVLRTSIIGIEKNNFHNLLSWIFKQENKQINGYTNHTWNGITTLQFAKIIEGFINGKMPKNDLYHIFSKRIVTKYELLKMVIKKFQLKISLVNFQTETPLLRHLSTEKDLNESISIPDIEEQIVELRTYCEDNKIPWKSI